MHFSLESLEAAKAVELPSQEEIFTMTDYDKAIWTKAFEWYNKYCDTKLSMACKPCFSIVYNALREAKQTHKIKHFEPPHEKH